MKLSKALFSLSFIVVVGLFASLGLMALAQGQTVQAAGPVTGSAAASGPGAALPPGNYCVECHTPGDERLADAARWTGTIDREAVNPCPAINNIHEEVYYTERVLLGIDRIAAGLPVSEAVAKVNTRYASTLQGYNRLLDLPVDSQEAFASQAQVVRYSLGKVYNQYSGLVDSQQSRWVLIGGIAVTLVVVASLAWGFINTHKMVKYSTRELRGLVSAPAILSLLVIFALFAMPIFRVPSVEDVSTEEEQAVQAVLDEGGRAADAEGRAQARIWESARIGALRASDDPDFAARALESSLAMADYTYQNSAAVWGAAAAAYEISTGSDVSLEKANLLSSELKAAVARTWGLRLAAYEWLDVDPQQAVALLEKALIQSQAEEQPYRDLDRRALAVVWAEIDVEKGLEVLSLVKDPALRSWGLREIAVIAGDPGLFQEAAEAAADVSDPVQQARLLREIGAAAKDKSYFNQAREVLQGVEGAAQAYALADLAAAAGDPDAATSISAAYPGARTAALLYTGQYEAAWQEALRIPDPYERARAQEAIAASWGDADRAAQIQVPALRDRALRRIAVSRGDENLALQIESPYERVSALIALGSYEAAWQVVQAGEGVKLSETSPLKDLALALADSDPQKAMLVLDELDSEADKAPVLAALARATGDPELFDRALGMALAARVRGDTLAPAEASLALAQEVENLGAEYVQLAVQQAFEAAESISVK